MRVTGWMSLLVGILLPLDLALLGTKPDRTTGDWSKVEMAVFLGQSGCHACNSLVPTIRSNFINDLVCDTGN